MVALEPGMIVSNEPGYYKAGALRHPHREPGAGDARRRASPAASATMLGFETLTLCPYDRRLIDAALLIAAERAWVDALPRTGPRRRCPASSPVRRGPGSRKRPGSL